MKTLLSLLLSFLLFSCNNQEKKHQQVPKQASNTVEKITIDTILERNNPQALDWSQHQLFIDTTRKRGFYTNLINRPTDQSDSKVLQSYFAELNKYSRTRKVELGNFPRNFVRLHQLEDDFVLYDRCDGIDPRYELRDTAVLIYGPLESDAKTINKLHYKNKKGIKLQLNTLATRTNYALESLEITTTATKNVYLLHYQGAKKYITPIENRHQFDVVVNHCPNGKVAEYAPFYK